MNEQENILGEKNVNVNIDNRPTNKFTFSLEMEITEPTAARFQALFTVWSDTALTLLSQWIDRHTKEADLEWMRKNSINPEE